MIAIMGCGGRPLAAPCFCWQSCTSVFAHSSYIYTHCAIRWGAMTSIPKSALAGEPLLRCNLGFKRQAQAGKCVVERSVLIGASRNIHVDVHLARSHGCRARRLIGMIEHKTLFCSQLCSAQRFQLAGIGRSCFPTPKLCALYLLGP